MAWLDERIWCHPKFADISDRAFRVYVNGVAYSAGFGCKGVLSPGQQRTIGSDAKVRIELVSARLWDEGDEGAALIHDWEEHNGKRDERREKDRARKKASRSSGASSGTSAGQSSRQTGGASTGAACVDGSEGSEGSEKTSRPVGDYDSVIDLKIRTAAEVLASSIRESDRDDGTRKVIVAYAQELLEADFKDVLRALKDSRREGVMRNEARWVNGALKKRAIERAGVAA